MANNKKRRVIGLKKRFKLVLMDDSTFEEKGSFRLTMGNIVFGISFLVFLLIVSGGLLMTFTPLKQWIPDYPDAKIRQSIIDNSIRLDSLTNYIRIQDQYITNLKEILGGNISTDPPSADDVKQNHSALVDLQNQREYDSIIRERVEFDKQTNIAVLQQTNKKANISTIQFFPPVKGVVSNVFRANEQHFGIDIVTKPETFVCAALSGTVIYKGWTLEGGNVIQIQHDNNLITVYKHNASILKNQGDYVLVGEPIAVVGNSGEYSTGPHLHFEIWHDGVPINPGNYVSFN